MRGLELTGKKFGKITPLSKFKREGDGDIYWRCVCDCGEIVEIPAYRVKDYKECAKCKKGKFYKQIDFIDENTVRIIIPTKKYGDCELLVDADCLDSVKQYWWAIHKPKKVMYARAWVKLNENHKRKSVSIHQFILGFPGGIIDHKNGNGLDNRKSNLRMATASESAANRGVGRDELIQWKGVSYIPHKKLYVVQLSKNNKVLNFGRFKNPLLAAAKYNEVAPKIHGEFARLNEFTPEQLLEIQNPPIETRRISRNNITGYVGVSKLKKNISKPYVATIYVNGRNICLGNFSDAKLAAEAYNKAAIKYRGEKASLNIIK